MNEQKTLDYARIAQAIGYIIFPVLQRPGNSEHREKKEGGIYAAF